MDTVESLPPSMRFRSRLLAFLVHHNPFYLLSALCMIAGCYALNSALAPRSGEIGKVLLLVGTLQLYELLLIGLGLYLITKHSLERDGRTLLLLDLVFLVDLTFLSAEMSATSLATGVAVNAIALVLALGKIALVLSVLTVRFPWRTFNVAAAQLVLLLGVPCALKWIERPGSADAGVDAGHLYAAWWAAGALLMLVEAQRQLLGDDPAEAARGPGVRRTMAHLYCVVPFVSLVAHLGMLHWVYRVDYRLANAAPILLGMAVLLARRAPQWMKPSDHAFFRVALPAAALAMSLHYPAGLGVDLTGTPRGHLTPPMLTAAAAYVAYVYVLLLPYAVWFLGAGAALAGMLLFGPTPAQMAAGGDYAWKFAAALVRRLIPKSAAQWGVVAVSFSFMFLGIGAALSLRKPKGDEVATPH